MDIRSFGMRVPRLERRNRFVSKRATAQIESCVFHSGLRIVMPCGAAAGDIGHWVMAGVKTNARLMGGNPALRCVCPWPAPCPEHARDHRNRRGWLINSYCGRESMRLLSLIVQCRTSPAPCNRMRTSCFSSRTPRLCPRRTPRRRRLGWPASRHCAR